MTYTEKINAKKIKKIKKIKTKIAAFILCAVTLVASLAMPVSAEASAAPELTSNNAVAVVNAENGQLLYQNRSDERIAPTASAKLAAMMVVWDQLEKHGLSLDTRITVPQGTLSQIGELGDISAPRLGITPGDSYTISDMLSASLVANANDACWTLAYYCATDLLGGTMEDFVTLMNAKAKEAGASDTNYVNCTGLSAAGAYTTAYDTALIAVKFYSYSELVRISGQASFRLDGKTNIHSKNYLVSSQLVDDYYTKSASGMIAGQNTQSGEYCLITSTVTDKKIKYIFVVMDASGEIRNTDGTRTFEAGNAYDDIKKLIPWATESFEYRDLIKEGDAVAEIKVAQGKNYDYVQLIADGDLELLINSTISESGITRKVIYDSKVYDGVYNGESSKMIDAPVKKGDVLGRLTFFSDGILLGEVALVAVRDVESSGLLNAVGNMQDVLFSDLATTVIKVLLIILAAFLLISFVMFIVRKSSAAKRKKKADISASRRRDAGGRDR